MDTEYDAWAEQNRLYLHLSWGVISYHMYMLHVNNPHIIVVANSEPWFYGLFHNIRRPSTSDFSFGSYI